VRCEVLSALLRARGFEEVYQLDGGVVRYGEVFGSGGLWEGSLYVFDERMHVELGPGSTPLGACTRCEAPTAKYENCADPSCRTLQLYCPACVHVARTTRCETCVRERPAALTGSPSPR
jgi:UPF0176 protein